MCWRRLGGGFYFLELPSFDFDTPAASGRVRPALHKSYYALSAIRAIQNCAYHSVELKTHVLYDN